MNGPAENGQAYHDSGFVGPALEASVRSELALQLAEATRDDGKVDLEAMVAMVVRSTAAGVAASRAQTAQFEAVLDNMAQGLCLFDAGQRLLVSNARFAEIYGLRPEHVEVGATFQDIVEQRYLAGTTPAMTASEYLLWRQKLDEDQQPHTSVVELQDGRLIAIRHQPMAGGGWVATHEDISDRIETERRLGYLARHDPVTGLPNRAMVLEQLQEALGRSSRGAPCTALAVSLDGFPTVNDALGRHVGDELLRIMAGRLRRVLRPSELLGLQGSNEFLIVQCGMAQPEGASQLAERLLELIGEASTLEGKRIVVTASIGIATAFEAASDAELLMKNASMALHWARTEGRGHYRLFEPEMDEVVQARHALEGDLREAVRTTAFQLHYQPQFSLRTGRVTGFEALLRWDHPKRGSVPPADFINVAEEIKLIGEIGRWVIEQACIEAASWPGELNIAVNVSASQLKDGMLPGVVAAALDRSGLLPARLELEITETCMVENAAIAGASLNELRALGVRVAMDDFGTGYSSLGALPNLPFDKIKIDRSLVSKLGDGAAHTAIIRAIVTLCSSLGVDCVAEGVETVEQLDVLKLEDCGEVQGYLLGRPGPAGRVAGVLAESRLGMATGGLRVVGGERGGPAEAAAGPVISFGDVVHSANDVIIVTDTDLDPPGPRILYVNRAFTRLTGFESHEAVGRSPRILQGPGTSRVALDEIVAGLRAGREVHRKVLNYSKNGAPYWLDLRIVPLRNAAGEVFQFAAIERDVTLDKRRLDELEYVADRDTLTGIPNRRALLRSMDAELQACRLRGGPGACLAFIDVDHFKRINDVHGHAVGDAVLFEIADRLASNIRRVDMLGRIGGEEFAVWMPAVSLREAAAIAERLRWAVAGEAFHAGAGSIGVSVSVGVAMARVDEHSLAALMERADRAMYLAKEGGRDRVAVEAVMLGG